MIGLCVRLLVACLFLTACRGEPSDRTPEGAMMLFLDALGRSEWEPRALEDAYALLSKDAKEALQKRAELASSLSGREFAPWEMLVQGRSRLRAGPSGTDAFDVRVEGEHAWLKMRGQAGGDEVAMTREEGRWRVVLDVPPTGRRSDR